MRVSLLKLRTMNFGNQLISSLPPSEGNKGGGLSRMLKLLILWCLNIFKCVVKFHEY